MSEAEQLLHVPTAPLQSPQHLTQSILQIAAMLVMYRAERAPVLHLQCGLVQLAPAGK